MNTTVKIRHLRALKEGDTYVVVGDIGKLSRSLTSLEFRYGGKFSIKTCLLITTPHFEPHAHKAIIITCIKPTVKKGMKK